jgi:DNA repair exonuclease SbcCD ATPase subunit
MRKYVKVIAGKNWQGQNFEHELEPLTAVVGRNRSGKSTIPNALRVALLGYDPTVGNKPGKTFGFIGNPSGAAEGRLDLKLSDGTWTKHVWRSTKGKIEYTAPEAPVKIPPVLLDLQKEFFGKSGPAQADLIFSKMDLEALGFTCEAVTARLKGDVKVETPTKETEAALKLIVEDVESLDQERAEFGWTYPLWMQKVVEGVTERRDAAKETLENMAGTIQGTAQLKAGEEIAEPFSKAELDAAREKLQALATKQKEYAAAVEKYQQRGRMYNAFRTALETVPDYTGAIAELEKEIAELDAKLAEFKEPERTLLQGKEQESNWLVEQVTELKTRIDLKGEEIKKLEAQLKIDKQSKCCPRCASKGTGWKKSLTRDAEVIKNEKAALAQLEKDHAERTKQKAKADEWFAKLEEDRGAQRGREILRRNRANEVERLKRESSKVKVQIPAGESFIEQTFEVAVARDRLKALTEEAPEPSREGVPTNEEVVAQRDRVVKLEEAERASIRSQGDKLRMAEAQAKHDTAAAEHEVAKLALAVLKTIKADMMEKAFGGFMAKVNQFTKDFFPALTYRDGEIGYFNGAAWVGWEFLCGTEKMLASIGLAVALAEEAPVRIVVIDEWLRDGETRVAVLARLKHLIEADIIDQAIFLDTDLHRLEAFGFKVVAV